MERYSSKKCNGSASSSHRLLVCFQSGLPHLSCTLRILALWKLLLAVRMLCSSCRGDLSRVEQTEQQDSQFSQLLDQPAHIVR